MEDDFDMWFDNLLLEIKRDPEGFEKVRGFITEIESVSYAKYPVNFVPPTESEGGYLVPKHIALELMCLMEPEYGGEVESSNHFLFW